MMTEEIDKLTLLLDHRAIEDVILLYSRAVDRKDYDSLDRCYWPDAYDNHIFYQGGFAGFKEWVIHNTKDCPTTHFLGNLLIQQTSTTAAFVETYVLVIHDMLVENCREHVVFGGRFLDKMQKRGDEWRIAHREITVDFQSRGPNNADWNQITAANRGGSRPNDALYRLHPTA